MSEARLFSSLKTAMTTLSRGSADTLLVILPLRTIIGIESIWFGETRIPDPIHARFLQN
jgi:hypothetical protein